MGALNAAGPALALVLSLISADAPAQQVERWRPLAAQAAARFGLPLAWVLAVIEAESGGRTELGGRPITSAAGAMGLMQIMPATWAELCARYRLGGNPHDPRDNIVAGTAYLRQMYDRFGYPGLFAAYNAGPGRYAQFAEHGRPLPRETRAYVARIMRHGDAASAVLWAGGGPSRGAQARRAPLLFARGGAALAGADPDGGSGQETAVPDSELAAAQALAAPAPDPIFLLRRDTGRRE